MVLDDDGFPVVYEVLRDSSGARVLYVDSALEEQAAVEHGAPLPGRRFAIERSADHAPDTIVAGILEPGPVPLGPFVYLDAAGLDAVGLICRCMPSRVDAIRENAEYRLVPREHAVPPEGLALADTRSAAAVGDALRLPASF